MNNFNDFNNFDQEQDFQNQIKNYQQMQQQMPQYQTYQTNEVRRNKKKSNKGIWALLIFIFIIIITGICFYIFEQTNNQNINSGTLAPSTDNNVGQMDSAKVYEETEASVITIINHQRQNLFEQGGDAAGTGFVYKKQDGYYYAITNNHVIDRSDSLDVLLSGGSNYIDAQLIGVDSAYDVAILRFKTSEDIKPLEFGNSDNLKPGQEVVAIGSPYGPELQGSITRGVVSAPLRNMDLTGNGTKQYIQIDAAINSGNSGGPLINANSQVVGINTLKISADGTDNIGFAIPSNEVIKIVNEIEKNTINRSR